MNIPLNNYKILSSPKNKSKKKYTIALISLALFSTFTIIAYLGSQKQTLTQPSSLLSFSTVFNYNKNPAIKEIAKDMILYYRDYRNSSDTDVLRLGLDIKAKSPPDYQYWDKIMKFWKYVNDKLVINNRIPDGLPQDDTLCIVILGLKLADDGSMLPELIRRLQTGLNFLNKYPAAFVAVTGGPTAEKNKTATEARAMADWLIKYGVDQNKILVDDKAMTTVENCQNVYAELVNNSKYKNVNKIAIVTSDYHIRRGSLLFNSQVLKSVHEKKLRFMQVIANAANPTKHEIEGDKLFAKCLGQITEVEISSEDLPPSLSRLDELEIEAKDYYLVGENPKFTVYAIYDNGFRRDVSDKAKVGPFDNTHVGKQIVKITYAENSVQLEREHEIHFSR